MKNVLTAAAVLLVATTAMGGEYDYTNRRPVDVFLLNNLWDHTFATKWCDSGTCSPASAYSCEESFGGTCDCAGYSSGGTYPNSCTQMNAGWEAYGVMWGYQCASRIAGKSYGSWGVCHQATATMHVYLVGNSGNMGSVRGWGTSSGMFGAYGSGGWGATCN